MAMGNQNILAMSARNDLKKDITWPDTLLQLTNYNGLLDTLDLGIIKLSKILSNSLWYVKSIYVCNMFSILGIN